MIKNSLVSFSVAVVLLGCMGNEKPKSPASQEQVAAAAAENAAKAPLESNQRFEGAHWGGKGFDHEGRYTRFSAQAHPPHNLLEIWIDQEKGVKTARLEFDSPAKKLMAGSCNKAERHITAPVKCDFELDKVRSLFSGTKATLFFTTHEGTPEESTVIPADELAKIIKGN